ncbi:sensor histidine kinase [Aeromicrobium sp. CF4.19]|uniref:sensor histidine kinase n=1 Tax=Aeromicrobium sp. CF4.19 TaxID=3373082 RepID=UPI003EE81E82
MIPLDRSWDRPGPTPRQIRADVWVGVVAAVIGIASVEVYRSASGASVGWQGLEAYLWFALAGLLLIGRRRYPLTTLALVSAIFVAVGERLTELGVVFTIQMILFAAFYSAWAWSRRPRSLLVVSVTVLLGMFGWLLYQLASPAMIVPGESSGLIPAQAAIVTYSLTINVVYFFGAIAWGQAAWLSARRSAQVSAQMERERDQNEAERRRAVQTERVRIARDLHDVVAHHVSGIGVQAAGASRLLESRPESARKALGTIEASSRQAVRQMHQLVGLLRAADEERSGERTPQPGLEAIAGLVDATTGLEAEYHEVGERLAVPPTVGVSLYRVAQEALTNVQRHAAAKKVTITVRYRDPGDEPASVEAEIVDDGRGAAARTSDESGGFGLAGIRERAEMHSGVTEIGPRPQGGFRVRVRIPVEGDA